MKIVVIGTRGFPDVQGGVEKHCEEIYPFMVNAGTDVTVLTRKPYVKEERQNFKGVKLKAVSCPKNKFLEAITHSFKALFRAKRLNPDIVHVHAVGPALIVPFAKLLGLKTVFTHHGPDYERKKWNFLAKAVLRFGEFCGVKFADRVITISPVLKEHIKLKYDRTPIVIPNGVTISDRVTSGEMLEKYKLEQARYILTVGRFVPEKGFHDLIDAFNQMFEKRRPQKKEETGNAYGSDWKLVIIGDADHQDEYSRNLRRNSEGNDKIILTGFLSGEAIHELYSNAGLFVLPSYYEGLPLVLLEAMSYGLRCLASDIAPNRCVRLPDDQYFKAGDIGALSHKIENYMDKALTEEEREMQIGILKKDYDWKTIAERTLNIYKETVQNESPSYRRSGFYRIKCR